MELQTVKRKVSQNEIVYSTNLEQSVELDYILPDYYPDIFKIIKCIMCPNITSVSTSGQRISFDCDVNIKVLYLTNDDNNIKCIEQKFNYSKNIEIDNNDEVNACICPKITYNNCRAVNERRISIRGTVSNQIVANSVNEKDILSDAQGYGVELKKQGENILDNLICQNKKFSYTEEINLSESKEAISCIYDVSVNLSSVDYKIIANKIVIKAKATVEIIYSCEGQIKNKTELIQLSNIVDADGITDEHDCKVLLKINSCEYEVIGEESAVLNLTLNCESICNAFIEDDVEVVTDAYSTKYHINSTNENLNICKFEKKIDDNLEVNTSIKIDDISLVDAVIVKIEDAPCTVKDSKISGSLNVLVVGKNTNDEIVYSEKTSVFEYDSKIEATNLFGAIDFSARSYSFTLSADGNIDIRTDLSIEGFVFLNFTIQVISDIEIGEEKQNTSCSGIIIYYAEPNESVWEIAKRYNSSAQAIIREN